MNLFYDNIKHSKVPVVGSIPTEGNSLLNSPLKSQCGRNMGYSVDLFCIFF